MSKIGWSTLKITMGLPRSKTKKALAVDEYLSFERDADVRHEFLDGEVFAMAGESLSHSRICMNLGASAHSKLKGSNCEALSPNMKVRTSTASLFSYPDMTVVCGEPVMHDDKKDVLTNPKVIFEVLSPSTENYDRTTKFQRYRMGNDTLTDYILVSQAAPYVEHYCKQDDGNWTYHCFSHMSDALVIGSIGIEFSLSEIYARVVFPKPSDEIDGIDREQTS